MPNSSFDTLCDLLKSLEDSRQLKRFYHLEGALRPTRADRRSGGSRRPLLEQLPRSGEPSRSHRSRHAGLKKYGAGTASVRFICGTLVCHRELEATIAKFVGTEAALSYVSCWNANEAVFQTLAGPDDVILSDELNHASIIDGIRLVPKAIERAVYKHSDLADLEAKLKQHAGKACRWVVTDGVFSMEGDVAPLPELIALCRKYEALLVLMIPTASARGKTGRGTPEHAGCFGEVDILTGTLAEGLAGQPAAM